MSEGIYHSLISRQNFPNFPRRVEDRVGPCRTSIRLRLYASTVRVYIVIDEIHSPERVPESSAHIGILEDSAVLL